MLQGIFLKYSIYYVIHIFIVISTKQHKKVNFIYIILYRTKMKLVTCKAYAFLDMEMQCSELP